MTAPFKDFTAVIDYIKAHDAQFGFSPERITLNAEAWASYKSHKWDNKGREVVSVFPRSGVEMLMGVPLFQSEESKREDAQRAAAQSRAAQNVVYFSNSKEMGAGNDAPVSKGSKTFIVGDTTSDEQLARVQADALLVTATRASNSYNFTGNKLDFELTTPPRWGATPEIRYAGVPVASSHALHRKLQQKWRNNLSGTIEWRDVPTVVEEP